MSDNVTASFAINTNKQKRKLSKKKGGNLTCIPNKNTFNEHKGNKQRIAVYLIILILTAVL